ncbi:class I SAM-dependent rRNA methyltransferase [Treponema parvum]|uniref:Class I SAM-dependent rRNA methyltransferase n=1 Tax=Treponema parvum TaxID=138851 RepID=A0A975F3B9_9SPIR|nr:class I SAM-dependent rRNA methyltransferase [Treponema parvum]QTQ13627.1 class I SAM-dependent rRNA methyltransferase [Treponema parvum]
MSDFARVFLKPREEKEIEQGFPWVFDNEIDFIKYLENGKRTQAPLPQCNVKDGSAVEVFTKAGGFLGTGIINRTSKITVRMIGNEHADKIYKDLSGYWSKKIYNAFNVRRLNYSDEDSYRLIFGEADLIPGLIVERYCTESHKVYLVVQFLALSCEVFRNEILEALKKTCSPYGIYERSDAEVREKEGLKRTAGWIGAAREETITIVENGIKLKVDLAHGQKTGYFLDQKFNRRAAAHYCRGKKVLDAFCHTGAFGLNAAKAGAREVICADISPEAIEIVNENIRVNGFEKIIKTECADVFDLLKKYEADDEKFDVIILDPPAFTKSAKMIKKAYGGYKEINLRAMRLLNEGGFLITCSCSYFFDSVTFYSMLMHAAADSHKRVQIIEKRGAAYDHPVLLGDPKSEYLKCAIARII